MLHANEIDLFDSIVTLLSASSRQCKNPVFQLGEDGLQVCGAPVYKQYSYCLKCCKVNFDHFEEKRK